MSNKKTGSRLSVPEGKYANFFRIGFNAQEFLLDFGQLSQGDDEDGEESYHSRIVVVPVNTKRFLALLQESVASYEDTFADIPDAAE